MRKLLLPLLVILLGGFATEDGCNSSQPTSASDSVSKLTVAVPTQSDGLTVEQANIKARLDLDNQPGSVKHLYLLSAYTGQVILYSTVKGKVTSSGKRLSPNSVATGSSSSGIPVQVGKNIEYTSEVLQDDGTYGSSIDYLYWWDSGNQFHQQYVSGGTVMHISDKPMAFGSVTMEMKHTK